MADQSEQGLVEIIPLEGGYDKISLRGDALPLQGLEFPTEQRLATKYYVGNPEATQTVGGPTKPGATWMGHWMDVTLGDGQARVLVRQFEFLCERAIPVEVRWGGRSFPAGEDPAIVRRGLIKKFTPKYKRLQDVEWTCEFEWKGQGLQTKPPTFSSGFTASSDFSALTETLEQAQDQTQSWMDVVGGVVSNGTNAMLALSDALDDVQNAIIDAINVVDGATGMLQSAAELPSEIADRVRGVCDRAVLACENGRSALAAACGLWPGLAGVFTGGDMEAAGKFSQTQAQRAKLAMFPTDDPLDRLDGQTAQFDLIRSWDLLAEQASMASATLAGRQVPDIIAILRPPAGSDLRDIAAKAEIYGDPDLWYYIADFNDLPSSEVPASPSGPSDNGAPPIYVPRLTDRSTALTQTWGHEP
jgi:hypothetical protein